MRMDIRVISRGGGIINVTRLHLKARNVFLIGLTEDMEKEVLIERCTSREEAIAYLDAIKDAIKVGTVEESESILIDLEGKKYGCCNLENVHKRGLFTYLLAKGGGDGKQ